MAEDGDEEEPCNAMLLCLPAYCYSCPSGTTVWYHQRGESCAPLGDLCASPRHRHQSLDLAIDAALWPPVKKDGGRGCRTEGGPGAALLLLLLHPLLHVCVLLLLSGLLSSSRILEHAAARPPGLDEANG